LIKNVAKNELRKLLNKRHRSFKCVFTREISYCFHGIEKVVTLGRKRTEYCNLKITEGKKTRVRNAFGVLTINE